MCYLNRVLRRNQIFFFFSLPINRKKHQIQYEFQEFPPFYHIHSSQASYIHYHAINDSPNSTILENVPISINISFYFNRPSQIRAMRCWLAHKLMKRLPRSLPICTLHRHKASYCDSQWEPINHSMYSRSKYRSQNRVSGNPSKYHMSNALG